MQKPILDKIIVVDIETTCWRQDEWPKLEDGSKVRSEIIEIGICLLDIRSKVVSENKGFIIKPERTEVSKFCENLTTLKQEDVDKGQSLVSAISTITDIYKAPKRVWSSYGFFDKNHVSQECYDKRIKYPFSQRHINVKTLFAVKNELREEVGMARALDMLKIQPIGIHHRGVDDAANIAKILAVTIEGREEEFRKLIEELEKEDRKLKEELKRVTSERDQLRILHEPLP